MCVIPSFHTSGSPRSDPYLFLEPWLCVVIQVEPGQAGWRKFREGRTYKDKGEPIGRKPDHLAGTATAWSLGSLCPWHFWILDIFVWCCHCLLIWLALVIFESWQSFLLASCLDVFFSLTFLFQLPLLMMALSLHPVCACHLWILPACFLLTAQEVGSWHTLLSWQFSFPTLFTLLLSSLLFPCCFLLSSVPTLFTSQLSSTIYSSHLYCLDIPTFLTSFLFTSLLSSHLHTFFTSLSSV